MREEKEKVREDGLYFMLIFEKDEITVLSLSREGGGGKVVAVREKERGEVLSILGAQEPNLSTALVGGALD